ncbi:beta-lactamase family protein [Pseudonocardia sp. S2-4]|uniref:Beta-lactamase family protein n=1 Tax=Pseudonocardia humida TaxID=2800819 RepID=A0ABT1A3C0_9PSEU|nr:beta-lactamase family protein [Pseudonocardia humida]
MVQGILDELVGSGAELGLQAAVYRRGELVVDAVAGTADPATGRPVAPDTPFYAASTGKGVTATVVNVLVERGVLGYDAPVVELWPEYGAHGKAGTTLRHLLTHSAGIPVLPHATTWDGLCDWTATCAAIADTAPAWTPGAASGYHTLTAGFVLGELVRRATGSPISRVLAEEVAGPLGVADELFLGVPERAADRSARFVDDPEGTALFAELVAGVSTEESELVSDAALANRVEVLRHDIPGIGTTSARAVARMYAALLDEVEGVRLLPPARAGEVATLATAGTDRTVGGPAAYGLGYSVGAVGHAPSAPTLFGAAGVGGSAAFADTATGVSVAVTKNRLDPTQFVAFSRVRAAVAEAFAA